MSDEKLRCKESVPGLGGWYRSTCSRTATKDKRRTKEGNVIFTKCGQHSGEGTAKRKQKRKDRYAKERAADDVRWAAEKARKALVAAVKELLNEASCAEFPDQRMNGFWKCRLGNLVALAEKKA